MELSAIKQVGVDRKRVFGEEKMLKLEYFYIYQLQYTNRYNLINVILARSDVIRSIYVADPDGSCVVSSVSLSLDF